MNCRNALTPESLSLDFEDHYVTTVKVVMSRRRTAGAAIFIVAIIIAFSIPFLSQAPPRPGGTSPPAPSGGGGNVQTDTEAPRTTITITGPTRLKRQSVPYFYPNFTVTLRATDNAGLSMIILNDTGTPTTFHISGTSAEVTLVITAQGLHILQYYSIDSAGNRETPHSKDADITRPRLADLIDFIENSDIDHGTKKGLIAKLKAAERGLDKGHELHGLNSLVNRLPRMEGKHGLDSETIKTILDMISVIFFH